jgi:hypothetical protein
MRFGVLIGIIAALAAAQAAHGDGFIPGALAQTSSAPPLPSPSGACGGWASTTFNDGCAGAPKASAYTIQHPDFFSGYARQSGQSYVTKGGCKGEPNCHPPWAVAGVDYPVGVSTVGTGFASPGSATDPTNASSPNYSNGNPGKCARSGSANVIVCKGSTSQEVDIGPFDFSYQGNATGVGMGLTLGSGLTGPCVIHDSYFVYDLNATTRNIGVAAYNFTGCSSLTIRNSVFRLRNDSTGVMDAMWAPPGSKFLSYLLNGGPRLGNINNQLNLEYDAFIHCPSRCFATGALNASHNYLEGVNMYDSTGSAAHGDGWMTSFYNGSSGPPRQICNCSGMNSLVEKFDTWLAPNIGAGATSCFTCAIVNLPAGIVKGTSTAGSNILHVTEIRMGLAGAHPSVGMPISGLSPFAAYKNPPPPAPVPVIAGCPNDTCDGSPGDYTLNVPWTVTCRTNNCGWGLIFRATVDTADYENNVWVGNIINATGAAGRVFCTGPGCGANQSVWWAGYGIYQNVIVKNNYADMCGIGGAFKQTRDTTGPPDYHCVVPMTTANQSFGGASPEASLAEGGNVMMTNGGCFSLWKPQTSC